MEMFYDIFGAGIGAICAVWLYRIWRELVK